MTLEEKKQKGKNSSIVFKELADKVKTARIELKLTQAQLGKMANTSREEISRLENGKINPSMIFMNDVAQALNKKLSYFFENI